MTFKEQMQNLLVNHGMFESQAQEVLMRVAAEGNEMVDRWDDDADQYPEIMLAILWATTKRVALEWIDDKMPKAWYRPMFVE